MRSSHQTELTSRPALIGPSSLGRETCIPFFCDSVERNVGKGKHRVTQRSP
jgi:hypothetical protein